MNQSKMMFNPLQVELIDSANALQESSSIWSSLTSSDLDSSSIYFSPGLVRRALVKTTTSSSSTSSTSSSFFSWPNHREQSTVQSKKEFNSPRPPLTPTLPRRSEKIDLSDVIANAQLQQSLGAPPKNCSFCRSNGEPEFIYTSHFLKVYHINLVSLLI